MVERRIWQVDPGDFHGDTQALTTTEVGAYFLLMLTYWRVGSLPDDDAALRRIARVQDARNWLRMKPKLQALFYDGWKHKRIESDLGRLDRTRELRSGAAHARWEGLGKTGKTIKARHESMMVAGFSRKPLTNNESAHASALNLKSPKTIESSFVTRQRRHKPLSVDNSLSESGPPRKPDSEKPNNRRTRFRARQAWENDLLRKIGERAFAEAIPVLTANPDLIERATAAELRERGNGLSVVVLGLRRILNTARATEGRHGKH